MAGNEEETNNNLEIKTMQLYSHVDRIYAELKELGYSRDSPLKLEDVSKFDQYHYYGTVAVDEAIKMLDIKSCHSVIDIGSGLGGPARYLANKTGCHVVAIELQEDVNQTAVDLTTRCQLNDKVTHLQGDFLTMKGDQLKDHDIAVSWLTFLHIPDKNTLLQKCYECLKSGGKLFIEDYYRIGPFTDEEKVLLKSEVYTEDLPTKEEYVEVIQKAGFSSIEFTDVTASWIEFVQPRVIKWQAEKERHVRVYGGDTVFKEQERFFTAISTVFTGGHIGGCKIVAQKP